MNWKRIFRKPFRPFLLDNKYRIVPAFSLGGIDYYMFDSEMEMPTQRALSALFIYGEMQMRCSREYLVQHVAAMERVLSNRTAIDLTTIMKLNMNLKERLDLMVLPEFIYKLASVTFFDKTESPYSYDIPYNERKIKSWKESGATLDFFMKSRLRDMIPFWNEEQHGSVTYLGVAEAVSKIHLDLLSDVLSESK